MNVIADEGVPGPADLQELGVARLTWGGGLASIAYAAAVRTVQAALVMSRRAASRGGSRARRGRA